MASNALNERAIKFLNGTNEFDSLKVRSDLKQRLDDLKDEIRRERGGDTPTISDVIEMALAALDRQRGTTPKSEDERICEALRIFLKDYRRKPVPLRLFYNLLMEGLRPYL